MSFSGFAPVAGTGPHFFRFVTSIETFRALLVMTITGAVMVAALFALRLLIKHRLPKTAQYYLWIVALAAFLVPTSAFISIPVPVAQARTTSLASAVDWYVVTAEDLFERTKPYERTIDGYVGVPEEFKETVDAIVPQPWVTNAVDKAKFLWYIGAFVSLWIFGLSFYSYTEYVIKKHSRVASPEQNAALAALAAKPPRLFRSAKAATPMLIGLFRPAIVLPDRAYTDDQLRAVLLHELTHLRRKDIVIKWMSVVACSLHWFNPLAWLARREIDRACELACDEAVILGLDADGRQNYGDTLIAVAADVKMPRTVLSTTMCERKKSLKERLGAIMSHKKATKTAIVCSVALVALLAGCVAFLGAGSGTRDNRIFFKTGERQEIARFGALVSSDYAEIAVAFVETSGSSEFLLSVEQEGTESQQQRVAVSETATFTVGGYTGSIVYAEPTGESAVNGYATFEVAQTRASNPPTPTYTNYEYGFSIAFPFEYGDAIEVVAAPSDVKPMSFGLTAPSYGIGRVAYIDVWPIAQSYRTNYDAMDVPYTVLGSNGKYGFVLCRATDLPMDPTNEENSAAFLAIRDAFDAKEYVFETMTATIGAQEVEVDMGDAGDATSYEVLSAWMRAYLDQITRLPSDHPQALKDFEITNVEVIDTRNDGEWILGAMLFSVKPYDVATTQWWAGNGVQGVGDKADWIVDKGQDVVLHRVSDKIWQCAGFGTGGFQLDDYV